MLRRALWIRQLEDAEELLDLRKNAEYALERWELRREKLKYDKHTAKKAISVQGAKLTSSPTPRPQKRKASSAASKPKDAKRARVDKYQSNDESKKDSGVKTATDVCSPEAPSLRPTVGCADTDRSEEAANATQDLTVPSPDTHSSGMAIDDADPRRKKIINRTKAQPTSLSSKTTPAKSAPGGANSDDKDQVDTTPAIGGSSLKRASTTAQKSTQGIESENARPARQEPSPKPLVADRGNNAKGSKDAQETSSISIPKQLPNVSLPPSSFSTEGRSDGGAEINGLGAAEMGRDDQEANDISNHQGSSDVSPPEPVRGGAEARNEDKAAFTDVEMGEAGLDAESQAEPDEEPDKRLVALVGVVVGAGVAAL
ncbi:hypothetical protein SLS63_013442 [Diaporthe eres]|uniref:Uncharacterized protein n=1 Tax=Diaporthe eres TaxID=83184 RepID=A0ABR1NNF2_DIAER